MGVRAIFVSLTLLFATSATAKQHCPSVDRPERPQFSHPSTGEIVLHFGSQGAVPSKFNMSIGYATAGGDAVRAAADGEVSHVQRSGPGQRLTLRHAQGYATAYAPMSEIAVQIGDCVSAGDPLGRAGATDAPLHFEMMINGRLVDPERIRGGLPPR